MPHVLIKHFPRTFTEVEKADLVASLTETILKAFPTTPGAVSIAVEPVEKARWAAEVTVPELTERAHLLWKQAEYVKPAPTDPTTNFTTGPATDSTTEGTS